MFGTKRHRSMQIVRSPLDEFSGDFDVWKARYWMFCTGRPGQFGVRDVVEVELLDFADEVGNSGSHAYFFFKMVEAAQMDGTPLEGVVFTLCFRWKRKEENGSQYLPIDSGNHQ